VRGAARTLAVLAGAVLIALVPAAGRATSDSPHDMVKADGELDSEKCGACHTPDMGLLMGSKLASCTLCHFETTHAGSAEHVRLKPDVVAQAIQGRPKDAVAMPLREDGGMWCGTCHLYHDPKVLGEAWLAQGWLPPDSGLAGAVRESVLGRWSRLAAAYDQTGTVAKFATQGTRMLRLPVGDGTLCRQCHGAMAGAPR
jgi:hypothetical protein